MLMHNHNPRHSYSRKLQSCCCESKIQEKRKPTIHDNTCTGPTKTTQNPKMVHVHGLIRSHYNIAFGSIRENPLPTAHLWAFWQGGHYGDMSQSSGQVMSTQTDPFPVLLAIPQLPVLSSGVWSPS